MRTWEWVCLIGAAGLAGFGGFLTHGHRESAGAAQQPTAAVLPSSTTESEPADDFRLDDAFHRGREEGWQAGLRAARQEAATRPSEDAITAATEAARSEARALGEREGYEAGVIDGYAQGRQQGYEEGRLQGLEEGWQQAETNPDPAAPQQR